MAQPAIKTTSLWKVSDGRVEATLPKPIVEAADITGGQPVAWTIDLKDGNVIWRLITDETVDGDAPNAKRIKHNVEPNEQYWVRWPKVLASMAGLDRLVAQESVAGRFTTANRGVIIETWPSTSATTAAPLTEGAPSPQTTRLHQSKDHTWMEVPKAIAGGLGLEGGEDATYRFGVRDGSLAVIVSFEDADQNRANVRRVQAHDSGRDGSPHQQIRLFVPQALVAALGWGGKEMLVEAPGGELVFRPVSTGPDQVMDSEVAQETSTEA